MDYVHATPGLGLSRDRPLSQKLHQAAKNKLVESAYSDHNMNPRTNPLLVGNSFLMSQYEHL